MQDLNTRTILARMRQLEVPGVSAAVLSDGIHTWSHGTLGVSSSAPVHDRTLFQACSLSKPVTAISALRLVQEGVLDLDREVNEFLTSWRLDSAAQQPTTLRQLLSHTAGTGVSGFPGYPVGQDAPSLRQVLEGERPSHFQQPPRHELLGATAVGHWLDGSAVPGGWHTYPELAAAGLWTTPRDIAQVIRELLAGVSGQTTRVLAGDMVRQMLWSRREGLSCGLGLRVMISDEGTQFFHGGANKGFRCLMLADVDSQFGMAIMTNAEGGGALCLATARDVLRSLGRTKLVRELEVAEQAHGT